MPTPDPTSTQAGPEAAPGGAWRWLPAVRRTERARFGFFLALQCLLTFSETLGLAGSEALLIGRHGAGALPLAFIAAACVTVASSMGYAAVVGRVRNDVLFGVMLIAAAGLLAGGTWASAAGVPGLPLALFCAYFVATAIFGNHFWTFAGDHFDTLASKRLFPLLTVGGSVGGALGGALGAGLAAVGPTEGLIAAWALGLAGSGGLLWAARRALRRWGPLAFEESDETSVEGLRAAVRHARATSMGRWMVVSAGAMVAALFVSQFLYSEIFARSFPSPEELAAFFGVFLLVSNSLEVLVEVAITPWLIRRFGLAKANLVHPITTLAAFVLLAVDFRLAPALLARANREMLENSLAEPVRNLVYNAVPPRLRGRMRALLEGIVVYSAMALAGALLVVTGSPEPWLLCLVGGSLAAIYLLANLGVQRAYLRALVDQLRSGRLDLGDLGEGLAAAPPDRLAALWRQLLETESDRVVAVELAPLLAGRGLVEPLREGAAHRDPRVRRAAVEALSRAAADPDAARAILAERLSDADPRVRAAAAAGLGSQGEALLASMARSGDPEEAEAALGCLPAGLAGSAAARVADPSPRLRGAALACLARLGAAGAADPGALEAAARDESPGVRRAAVEALGGLPERRAADALSRALDDPAAEVRGAAVAALARRDEIAFEAARERLGSSHGRVVASALDVLGGVDAEEARSLLRTSFRERVLGAWEHLLSMHALGRPADLAGRFLHAAHLDAFGRDLGLAFRALGRLEDGALVQSVERALRLGPAPARTEALEVLSNLGDREAAALLTLLHEEAPLEDRIRGVARLEGRPRTPDGVVGAADRSSERWVRFAVEGAGRPAGRETMERLLALRRVPLFGRFSLDQLEAIAGAMQEESFVAGEVVVREGEPGSELYLLLEGEVAIHSGLGTDSDVELNRLAAVTYFGEMAVLEDAPRSASVVVTRDARMASLAGQRLKELVLQMPEMSFDIFRELIARVRRAERARRGDRGSGG